MVLFRDWFDTSGRVKKIPGAIRVLYARHKRPNSIISLKSEDTQIGYRNHKLPQKGYPKGTISTKKNLFKQAFLGSPFIPPLLGVVVKFKSIYLNTS